MTRAARPVRAQHLKPPLPPPPQCHPSWEEGHQLARLAARPQCPTSLPLGKLYLSIQWKVFIVTVKKEHDLSLLGPALSPEVQASTTSHQLSRVATRSRTVNLLAVDSIKNRPLKRQPLGNNC